MTWTEEYENILKDWKAKSFVYMWLQLKSGYHFIFLNNILTYPVIILSSVTSAALFTSDNELLRTILAIFSVITVVLTGIALEISPGEKLEKHMSSMKRHATLIRNIDYCLSLPKHIRADPTIFIEKVSIEMDFIAENENVVPRYVIRRFEKKFGKIDKLLYGEEIIDLLAEDIKTVKTVLKLIKNPTYNKTNSDDSENQSNKKA